MMGKSLVITSGKGGVGKTTTTANLGIALAKKGKRVILLDADIGLRNLDAVLGLQSKIVFDLIDVINGYCTLKMATLKHASVNGLYFLPASQSFRHDMLKKEHLYRIVCELKLDYDYVIIDCPAGIERGFENSVFGVDESIIIVTPDVSAVRDAKEVIKKIDCNTINLIINRYRRKLAKKGLCLDIDDVARILKLPILGMIKENNSIIISSNLGIPLKDISKLTKQYDIIAAQLLNKNIKVIGLNRSMKHFFKALF